MSKGVPKELEDMVSLEVERLGERRARLNGIHPLEHRPLGTGSDRVPGRHWSLRERGNRVVQGYCPWAGILGAIRGPPAVLVSAELVPRISGRGHHIGRIGLGCGQHRQPSHLGPDDHAAVGRFLRWRGLIAVFGQGGWSVRRGRHPGARPGPSQLLFWGRVY